MPSTSTGGAGGQPKGTAQSRENAQNTGKDGIGFPIRRFRLMGKTESAEGQTIPAEGQTIPAEGQTESSFHILCNEP